MSTPDTIAPALGRALAERGYDALTPVQTAMLAPEADGRDLLVSAQTGSGKTVAFGIAIAPTLLGEDETFGPAATPLALLIAPTRELALQVRRELEWLYAGAGAHIASCVGGMDMRTERRKLDQGAHIVVGTPGRLRDHITRGSLDISMVRAVVLDEADEMLDLGFRDDLEFILGSAPPERRTLMFSATVPPAIAKLAKEFQRDALRLEVTAAGERHEDIDYRMLLVAPSDRENAVVNALIYFDANNALVFCATRETVRHMTSRLANRGFSVVSISGELSQAERTNALQSMRDGRARVCVATDVAARGIDLPNLDLVIHADLPSNPETLLHRSGRTGRAGRKGVCAVIVPHHRRRSAERLIKLAKIDAETSPAPGFTEIAERERQRLLADEGLRETPEAEDAELVAALIEAHGAEAIAAALVRRYRQSRPVPEELSSAPAPRYEAVKGERPTERFTEGVWFRITLGRTERAEPRWLLPLICRAGGVDKSVVGSIRILDHETRFEIATNAAERFQAAAFGKKLDRDAVIERVDPDAQPARPERKVHPKRDPKPYAKREAPVRDAPAPEAPTREKPARETGERKPYKARKPDVPNAEPVRPKRPEGEWAPKPKRERPARDELKPAPAKDTPRTLKRKAKKQKRKAEGRFA